MTRGFNGTLDNTDLPALDPVEWRVLEACREVTVRQAELVPLLAGALQVPEEEVFYAWAFRRCPQRGSVSGTDWRFFFHGLECDLRNAADGRFLRVDFGPGGRLDTFTAWGVLQFLMTSTNPWTEFPDLRRQFADKGPPFDQHAGSLSKLGPVWDRLEAHGVFEPAGPALVQFEADHTEVGPDGIRHIRLPADTPEKVYADCSVAHRPRISARGLRALDAHLAGVGR